MNTNGIDRVHGVQGALRMLDRNHRMLERAAGGSAAMRMIEANRRRTEQAIGPPPTMRMMEANRRRTEQAIGLPPALWTMDDGRRRMERQRSHVAAFARASTGTTREELIEKAAGAFSWLWVPGAARRHRPLEGHLRVQAIATVQIELDAAAGQAARARESSPRFCEGRQHGSSRRQRRDGRGSRDGPGGGDGDGPSDGDLGGGRPPRRWRSWLKAAAVVGFQLLLWLIPSPLDDNPPAAPRPPTVDEARPAPRVPSLLPPAKLTPNLWQRIDPPDLDHGERGSRGTQAVRP